MLDFFSTYYTMQAYIISKVNLMLSLIKRKFSCLVAIFVAFFLIGSIALAPASAQDDQWIFEDDSWEADWDTNDSYWDDWDDTLSEWEEDTYTFTTLTDPEAVAVLAGMSIFFIIFSFVVVLPMYIYFAIVLMTIAKKLNVKNGWFAWIPILNIILMFQCADLNPWLILLVFVPVANVIVSIFAWMKIAERRGFEAWLGILIILPLAKLDCSRIPSMG
jgi:hypothetical protein